MHVEIPVAEIVEHAVRETLTQIAADAELLPVDRLAFPEAEAAKLMGVAQHVLGDARRRGEIEGSRVGKKIVYTRPQLLAFLQRQRTGEFNA
ncbi:helix-turn-helix domain-containing protein [Symmachiella dynata]|uniref:helix-turn-helix domain-containing protein n=1 Tax=Symmachiella dynata TaxID=2527995 RepID=UPI0030EC28E5|tara:strand:+ start:352 stop:627 length:276 start_codon:yes stop_codon:yes gene_type:complete